MRKSPFTHRDHIVVHISSKAKRVSYSPTNPNQAVLGDPPYERSALAKIKGPKK